MSRPCEIPAQISTAGGEKTLTRLSLLFNPSQTSTRFLAIQFSKDGFTETLLLIASTKEVVF